MTRRILMNMKVSGAAMAAAAQITAAEASADTAAAVGAQFERLIVEYVDVGLEWARLHRAGCTTHREKFGAGYYNNLTDEGRAKFAAFEETLASNGCDQASERHTDLYEIMMPLAKTIKATPAAGMADLRARTLVALWEALPSDAYNEGELNFYSEYDGGAIRSMFDAAVTLTGLRPLVSEIEQSLAAGAAADVDTAEPAQGQTSQAGDDAKLLELEEKIFDLIHAIDEFNPEISRLQEIWTDEYQRLHDAVLTGESTLSGAEQSAIVRAMPECIEHTRLCNLQRPLDEEAGRLVKQMWEIPATTPEGRRAKFFVLLAYFMPREWSEASNKDADCDIEYARKFMIEMVGGECAEQLREQFAA
jgi:hypothetical protein